MMPVSYTHLDVYKRKDIFGLCVVLMIWNLVMPAGTIWTAAAYFGAVLAYLQRPGRVAAEDGTSAADGFSTEGGNRRGGCVFQMCIRDRGGCQRNRKTG